MNRRSAFFGSLVAAVVLGVTGMVAWRVSPAAVFERLTWLARDPVRLGAALLALAAVRPVLAWPTTLLAVVAGFGYGWLGVPLGVALVVVTVLPAYGLARAGRLGLRAESEAADRLCGAGERFTDAAGDVRAVAATRLLPLPSDAVSVGAGVAGVRLRPFLVGTALGELPWVIVGVAVGVSLDRLGAGTLAAVDPTALVAMAGLGALLLTGPVYRTVVRDRLAATA